MTYDIASRASLPISGELSYGGVRFMSLYNSKVSGRPVPDDAGRTNKCIEYIFDVYATVGGTSGVTGQNLEVIRTTLSKNGLDLLYKNKGFGGFGLVAGSPGATEFAVNEENGIVKDVAWGPKPQVIDFTPIGDSNKAMVHWQCKTWVPECPTLDPANFVGSIMAFGYELIRSYDASGFETISIVGYLEIPLTWNFADRNVSSSADVFWERIYPDVPDGYKPVRRTRRLSQDRRRLDFEIVWEEMPSRALPEGCTSAKGRMRIASSDRGMVNWNGTISATYTVAKDAPRSMAWDNFFALVGDRLAHIRQKANGGTLLLTRFAFDEGLYEDRDTSFELDFRFGCQLKDILNTSGVWREIPKTDSTLWKSSVTKFLGPYSGPPNIFRHQDEVIIDLCLTRADAIQAGIGPIDKSPAPAPKDVPSLPAPAQEGSWIEYVNAIGSRVKSGVVKHKPIPDVVADIQQAARAQQIANLMNKGAVSLGGAIGLLGRIANLAPLITDLDKKITGLTPSGDKGAQADKFQQAHTPEMEIVMAGYAVRAGFHIPVPELIALNGQVAVPIDQQGTQFSIGNFGGVPWYYAEWLLVYQVEHLPPEQEIQYPQNPLTDVPG